MIIAIIILFTASLFLFSLVLETFFNLQLSINLGLLTSAVIIFIFLIYDIIRTRLKNYVSRSNQFAILAYFENEILKSKELTAHYERALQIIDSCFEKTIQSVAQRLMLPSINELKNSIFYNYYKCFYLCPETLTLLYVYKQAHENVKLIHPFNERIISNYNPMSENDEKILTSYPWLIIMNL